MVPLDMKMTGMDEPHFSIVVFRSIGYTSSYQGMQALFFHFSCWALKKGSIGRFGKKR